MLSPLSGAYLLVILGEPISEDHKEKMLEKLRKGMYTCSFLSHMHFHLLFRISHLISSISLYLSRLVHVFALQFQAHLNFNPPSLGRRMPHSCDHVGRRWPRRHTLPLSSVLPLWGNIPLP